MLFQKWTPTLRRDIGSVSLQRAALYIASLTIFLLSVTPATAQQTLSNCGSFEGAFGDYRTDPRKLLRVVETHHFTPNIENLVRGNSGSLGAELSYTLNTFPNHHRALLAMVRLGERLKTTTPPGSKFAVECWLDRSIRYSPDDNIARLIYASYLGKNSRQKEATEHLEVTAQSVNANAFTHNNIGLVYFDMKNYEKALFHSHKAIELGLSVATLSDQLKNAGKWSEPDRSEPTLPITADTATPNAEPTKLAP